MKKEGTEINISENWQRLTEAIPDIEEQIQEDKIKIIRLKKGMKEPLDNDYYFKNVTLEQLKQHKGNFGIIAGYNNGKNGSSIAVADVDGLTINIKDNIPIEKKEEIKQLTKEYIYKSLKEAIPNALAVKTQSEGYHFYLWNETEVANFHKVSKSLTFPSDFPIAELRNKSLRHSIEIFTKFKSKYIVLPTSIITKLEDKKAKKVIELEEQREYTILNDVPIKLADIGTVNNIHDTIKESLVANGYGYSEGNISRSNRRNKSRSSNRRKSSSNSSLKKLSEKEITKVVELVTDKYKLFEVIDGSKHDGALALGGFFSYHITKNSSRRIASGIVKKIGSIFRDSEAFKDTILENYERPVEEKVGLPTLLELIEDYDSAFNFNGFSEDLNFICNPKYKKEKVATATINKKEVPVYLNETDTTKYLKYEGILEGIDLILNFNSLIGSFIYSKKGTEVDSFKFKFKNKYIEITKYNDLKEFLAEEEIILPDTFEKQLRRSVKSLDKSITKPKEKPSIASAPEEVTVEEDPNFLTFGVTEEGFYSQNSKAGIEYNVNIYREGEVVDIKTVPVANVIINEITIILDSLGILEPVYNVTYYNKTFKKEVAVEYLTKKQLTEEFIKANVFYKSTIENVETVLNAFIIDGTKEDTIEVKREAYLEGFFIVDGKVIENTKLKNIKKYTAEDVAKAIKLLNEIMKDRTEEGKANDSTVYRFMLWNPFSYCLKQLGFKTGIYSLILIGKSKGNKTGAIKVGNIFYMNTEEETTGSTVSVLGSKLEENSFSKVFDECYNLLKQPEAPDVMKKAVQDKTTRITKNRTDNKKSDVFNAFGLPVFLLNERMEFKDFIQERYKITDYTSKSYITEKKRKEFNKKYLPEAEDTVLNIFNVIGSEFKKKIVPIIEAKDKRLFNPEELTITILKEIAKETSAATGKPIDFLPEMYTITEASTKYNYDVAKEIRNYLNNEFKAKNKLTANSSYSGFTFVNSITNNDFDFITYNKFRTDRTIEKEFIVDSSGLVNYVNNHVEETVELETILEALDLTDILKSKAKKDKKTYSKFINSQHKIKVEGTEKEEYKNKNITGFYLTVEELANKLFSFNIDFSD